MLISLFYPHRKRIAAFFVLLIATEILSPMSAYALTGGPSQPEVQAFEPANTNQMVDVFSGNFTYNIPLGKVGDYPFNISYSIPRGVDDEASWVGYGWSFNPGVVNRNMRGLPDDFNGDEIVKEYSIKKNWTAGMETGFNAEIMGFGGGSGFGVYKNSYTGVGVKGSLSFAFSYDKQGSRGKNTSGVAPSVGLNLSFDSQGGIGVSPSLGLSMSKDNVDANASVGFNYNSREGMKALTYGISVSAKSNKKKSFNYKYKDKDGKTKGAKNGELKGGGGSSTSSSISFGSQSMMPNTGFANKNFAFQAKLKVGGETPAALKLSGFIAGSYSEQKVRTNKQALKAYGYMYMDKANMSPTVLLDFNREKDQPFRIPNRKSGDEGSPVLSLASSQFDLYGVSGQGIGGQYRAKRGEYASFYDHSVVDESISGALNMDYGVGSIGAFGLDINITHVDNTTSQWEGQNDLYSFLQFKGADNTDYEPFSFVNIGEKITSDPLIEQQFGGTDPIRAKIAGWGLFKYAEKKFERYKNKIKQGEIIPTRNKKAQRDKRNQAVSLITAGEAIMALDKDILDYPLNQFPITHCGNESNAIARINRLVHSGNRKDHITEIRALSPDGKRYVYGIPAYNRSQREVTFSVAAPSNIDYAVATGLAPYDSTSDNSIHNSKGRDNYFSADNIPGYAHSYLLTAVLSPDYVDLTGDGVSDDDLGDATRFNYSRAYGENDNDGRGLYHWRIPYAQGKANYQQGYKTNKRDDKASYIYGKKEMWWLNSVESKNEVAVFRISQRTDGLGTKGENGGKNTNANLPRLDSISIYSKSDLQKNGNNAVPIKTIHFEYDYVLCKGIDNSSNPNNGKLTLKKIWFTYQKNTKGKLNPYVFNYNTAAPLNPTYNMKKYDRWGNYQNNSAAGMNIPETEFPYTIQDTAIANQNARVWALNSIDLPSGGRINIDLEANRYAYVQDKRAMQMYFVYGLGNDSNAVKKNELYTNSAVSNPDNASQHNRFVYIKLPRPVPSGSYAEKQEYVRKRYMDGIENLYFNASVLMYPDHPLSEAEYVQGYCEINKFGLCPNISSNDIIWIELKGEPINNTGAEIANPIAKAAWQFIRMNLPGLAYPGSDTGDEGNSPIALIKALGNLAFEIQNMVMGFNKSCVKHKWCKYIVPEKSWIRLNNGNYSKLGGGARVKRVTITDNWRQMAVNDPTSRNAVYGQEYDYTMLDEDGNVISSGVAEWEPMVGNNENPFRQPLKYKQNTRMAPHNAFYIETPICESLFPGPDVGYRQVTVGSFGSAQVSADKRTGYTIHKFHTAKDFPVITDYTPSGNGAFHSDKTPGVLSLLNAPSFASFKGTQGFMIELNDMHGKPKSEEVYDNNGSLISSTEYTYKCKNISGGKKQLVNEFQVMKSDGTVTTAEVGKDVEITFDSREQKSVTASGGAMIQVDVNYIPPVIFLILPSVYPAFSYDEVRFNSITSTKVVRRFGILEKVTARQYGSMVATENLVLDEQTGDVLLTRTKNEFEDNVYNFTQPAYWAYPGMAPAFHNVGAIFKNVQISNGSIVAPTTPDIGQYFTAGDEVLIAKGSVINSGIFQSKAWVIDPSSTNPSAASQKIFVYENGSKVNLVDGTVKIVRSGHRNMQGATIASISSLQNPIVSGTLEPTLTSEILNTSITEYSDQWKVNCEKIPKVQCDTTTSVSCSCLKSILDSLYAKGSNIYNALPSDSAVINNCCLGGYSVPQYARAATSSFITPQYCPQQIYRISNDDTARYGQPYQMSIGGCTLSIQAWSKELATGVISESTWRFSAQVSLFWLLHGLDYYSDGSSDPPDYTCGDNYIQIGIPPEGIPGQKFYYYFKATISCGGGNCTRTCQDITPNQIINPYRYGLLGNWRPSKQWVYRDFRSPGSVSGSLDIRHDGVYKDYSKFWVYNSIKGRFVATPSSKYVTATTITKYNPNGAEIENQDAAGIYSSAVYGYLQTQPIAVAKNARYKQIGFDGFEDYDFITDCTNPCRTNHFGYPDVLGTSASIVDTVAHSGNRSVIVNSGQGITMVRDLKADKDSSAIAFETADSVYHLTVNGCLPKFSPDSGRYYFSAWVKEEQPCTTPNYIANQVNISFTGSSDTYTLTPSGRKIEKWQRVEGVFTIPVSATQINIELKSLSGNVFFDDVRVQPFNSSMKSYVYDWRTMRLMAELDENNFATFYEYDDEGGLVRVKKETERGIMTIKETRSSLKHP